MYTFCVASDSDDELTVFPLWLTTGAPTFIIVAVVLHSSIISRWSTLVIESIT